MPAEEALQFLEAEIDQRIGNFSKSLRFYRRGSLIQTVTTAVLGAVTTFLIAVNQIDKASWIAVVALLAAGATTISAAWTGWFGFRRLWTGYQSTLNRLRELRSTIRYAKATVGGVVPQSDVDRYYDQYQQIVTDLNQVWEVTRSGQREH